MTPLKALGSDLPLNARVLLAGFLLLAQSDEKPPKVGELSRRFCLSGTEVLSGLSALEEHGLVALKGRNECVLTPKALGHPLGKVVSGLQKSVLSPRKPPSAVLTLLSLWKRAYERSCAVKMPSSHSLPAQMRRLTRQFGVSTVEKAVLRFFDSYPYQETGRLPDLTDLAAYLKRNTLPNEQARI